MPEQRRSRPSALRRRTHELLEAADPGDRASAAVDAVIISLIVLNTVALVLETVEPIWARYAGFFVAFEIASVLIFTVEYVLRVWSAVSSPRFAGSVRGRLRFMRTPMAVIDLLAILPFYLPLTGLDLRFLRAFRLFRLFRLAKLGRYSAALQTFGRVIRTKKEELVVTLSVLVLLLLVASSLIYFVETEAQPEAFSSIPATMWWGIATLTTVGYGDIYPITALGRTLAAVIAVLGIGMVALPTGILGSAFVEELQRDEGEDEDTPTEATTCPHCGKEIGVSDRDRKD